MTGTSRAADSIDVVIPVFNGERFISIALSSVASQTSPPRQIIVVDDGSTDGTEQVVRSNDWSVPVSYIKKPNGGLSSARNAGVRESDSEYVAFLDADDVWEPRKLEKQIEVFDCSPSGRLGVVYCDVIPIDTDNRPTNESSVRLLDKRLRGWIYDGLICSNGVAGSGSSVLIKRDCFQEVGLFDETLFTCEDWDMWLRIAQRYEYDFVDEPLVRIRRVGSSMSANTDRMITGRLLVLSKLLRGNPESVVILQELRYQLLRFVAHRRFMIRRGDLTPYLDAALVKLLFSDHLGMWLAFRKALVKAGRKYLSKHVRS